MKKVGENLHDIKFGDNFLNEYPKQRQRKKKPDKLDIIKIKTFVHQRT